MADPGRNSNEHERATARSKAVALAIDLGVPTTPPWERPKQRERASTVAGGYGFDPFSADFFENLTWAAEAMRRAAEREQAAKRAAERAKRQEEADAANAAKDRTRHAGASRFADHPGRPHTWRVLRTEVTGYSASGAAEYSVRDHVCDVCGLEEKDRRWSRTVRKA